MTLDTPSINAMPTKAFFVDMLVKDISLERAILDLVDNCVDGAKRLRPEDTPDFSGLSARLSIAEDRFEICDNCGGFDSGIASSYAFRFGRPAGAESTRYSIGRFGVGMKRALFKFGRYFEIRSTTAHQRWSMKVDVDAWEEEENWTFAFDQLLTDQIFPQVDWGTKIIVTKLRPEVATKFSSAYFCRQLPELIRTHQRQFLRDRFAIIVGEEHLTATKLLIRSGGQFSPAIEECVFFEDSENPINVRIVAGVADSSPSEAGWYVICNGRVILAADRSEETGWGSVSEQRDGIPKYHNQYARFRGVVFFDCQSATMLPWNTTKTGLDSSSTVWQATCEKMIDHTRAIINFLNILDREAEESDESSPLLAALNKETRLREVETFHGKRSFSWNEAPRQSGPKTVKIQYSREETKIRNLMVALGVGSAKAVGETTFDLIFGEQGDDDE